MLFGPGLSRWVWRPQLGKHAVGTPALETIATELNARARTHPIGTLQEIRGHGPTVELFWVNSKAFGNRWAYHWGGRTELQFNIGFWDESHFRHGVAFSLKESREYKSQELMDILVPKIQRFNRFVKRHPETVEGMFLWIWDENQEAVVYDDGPGPIPMKHVSEEVFIFLGRRLPIRKIDYERILNDFDNLLPLYRYVERPGEVEVVSVPLETHFAFRPGCRTKKRSVIVQQCNEQIDRELRHNKLQERLYKRLTKQFGMGKVGTEIQGKNGTSIDVVVQHKSGYWFYEIKTAESARECIREALGQILEYAFWPGAQEAARLIIVGECPIDEDGGQYLRCLQERFSLPILYEQI